MKYRNIDINILHHTSWSPPTYGKQETECLGQVRVWVPFTPALVPGVMVKGTEGCVW